MNAANKKYSHHLGVAGYKKSVKKWQKMEQDLMDRGIRPTTWALKNPEHPGRARDIGVVPWKVAWAGDSSYKTHRKSKAE